MMKRCTVCKQEKAASEFNLNSTRKDGLQTRCKECNKVCAKAYQAAKVERDGRICRKCGKAKSLTEFSIVSNGIKLVRRRVCQACIRDRQTEVIQPKYREKNRIKLSEKERVRRQNPKNRAKIILGDTRNSDRKAGLDNNLTEKIIKDLISQGCPCGETKIKMTLDRKDNHIGHTVENCVPCCIRCNYLRRDMPYEAWVMLLPTIKLVRELGLFGLWTCEIHKK